MRNSAAVVVLQKTFMQQFDVLISSVNVEFSSSSGDDRKREREGLILQRDHFVNTVSRILADLSSFRDALISRLPS